MTMQLFNREGDARPTTGTDPKGHPVHGRPGLCARCGGEGRSSKWAHTGYTCFDCNGSGKSGRTVYERLYTTEALDVLNGRRDAGRAKKAVAAKIAADQRKAEQDAAIAARAEGLASDPLYQRLGRFAATSEFLGNAWALMAKQDLSEKHHAAVEAALARAEGHQELAATGQYLAAPGDRITITGKVERVHQVREATYYDAALYAITILTDAGAVVSWFTSSSTLETGQAVTGTATVKDHKEFRGVKQTAIKNPRWKKADQAA